MPSKRKWLERWENEKTHGKTSHSVKEKSQSKTSHPVLVKFCEPGHNILNGCQDIQFGTFEYYRERDPKDPIADENEGKDTTLVCSPSGMGSQEAIETLEQLTGFGRGSFTYIYGINFATFFPNCYIWCCSRIPETPVAKQGLRFNEGYTSYYAITDAGLWAKCLTHLLSDSLLKIPFEGSAKEKLNELSRQNKMNELQIGCIHRDVVYVDEKKSNIENGKVFPYAQDIPSQLRPIFVKPKRYSLDSEYRFVFLVQHPQEGILPVQKDPFKVQILPEHLAELPIRAL